MRLSLTKLRALEPELFEDRTFKCDPGCDADHPAEEMRERFEEYLAQGDSRAAMVVSLEPLVVAALSDDLDAAVLLRFPPELASRYELAVGSRLLTVNTYTEMKGVQSGKLFFAVDVVPGPHRRAWSNFAPPGGAGWDGKCTESAFSASLAPDPPPATPPRI